MSTSSTFYFNEIFPTIDEWQEFSSQIVNLTDDLNNKFDTYCYTILSRYFTHIDIRYYDIMAFKCQLANVYMNKFEMYKKQKEVIDFVYKLTLDELQIVNTAINNQAKNSNDEVTDPYKPLNFISDQNFSQVTNNKLQQYLEAINNMPTFNIDEFIRGKENDKTTINFIDLFKNVQPYQIYIYPKEE